MQIFLTETVNLLNVDRIDSVSEIQNMCKYHQMMIIEFDLSSLHRVDMSSLHRVDIENAISFYTRKERKELYVPILLS